MPPSLSPGCPAPCFERLGQRLDSLASSAEPDFIALFQCVCSFLHRSHVDMCLASLRCQLMFSAQDLQNLSFNQIWILVAQLVEELQRPDSLPEPPVFDRPAPTAFITTAAPLREPLCGYRCQFCHSACTRGSVHHTHHKCYQHRHFRQMMWTGGDGKGLHLSRQSDDSNHFFYLDL